MKGRRYEATGGKRIKGSENKKINKNKGGREILQRGRNRRNIEVEHGAVLEDGWGKCKQGGGGGEATRASKPQTLLS